MSDGERIHTLFGVCPTRRFVTIDEDDPRGPGDVVHGHDGRDYVVDQRHRFVEDHMLGEVFLGQTRSTVLFLRHAEAGGRSVDVPAVGEV